MRTYQVIIIGSGFGGQCAAVNLIKAGITDFRLLERRDFIGGTWCQNTYPGAAVDIPSPLYSLSFAPYPWTRLFAGQPELQRYTRHVVDKFGLLERIDLNTDVLGMEWDDTAQRWWVKTSQGSLRAQFVIIASGPLSQPAIPQVKGIERFAGAHFHSSQWDHAFDYRQKNVAIVGSGASAAQIIPAVAGQVAQLYVFQRTAHWVLPRPDRPFRALERRLLAHPGYYRLLRGLIYWKLEGRFIAFKHSKTALKIVQLMARRYLSRQVPDPELRRKLTPDYVIGCKRIVLSNDLYPALSRNNVTLFAGGEGIDSMEESALITTQGRRIEVDAIIFATGFQATDHVIPFVIEGREGKRLEDVWEPFPHAYLGASVPDFPNLFIVTGPNTATGHTSQLFVIEAQMSYIRACICAVRDEAAQSIEARHEAEAAYTQMIQRELQRTVWQWGGCHSWYQNHSGRVVTMFPGFSFNYYRATRQLKRGDHVVRH